MRIILLFVFIIVISASCKKTEISAEVKDIYTVINKGIGGNTADDLVKRLSDVYDNNPDLVILMIGTNDVHKTPLSRYKADLDTMVSLFATRGIKVLLMSPPPHGTKEISNPEDDTNKRIDAEVNIMDALSTQKQCFYLDMNAAFKARGTPNPTATSLINNAATNPSQPDGIHPNKQGYIFMSHQIYDYLKANDLLKYKKILCFGDSITHGAYPKLLANLLNGL